MVKVDSLRESEAVESIKNSLDDAADKNAFDIDIARVDDVLPLNPVLFDAFTFVLSPEIFGSLLSELVGSILQLGGKVGCYFDHVKFDANMLYVCEGLSDRNFHKLASKQVKIVYASFIKHTKIANAALQINHYIVSSSCFAPSHPLLVSPAQDALAILKKLPSFMKGQSVCLADSIDTANKNLFKNAVVAYGGNVEKEVGPATTHLVVASNEWSYSDLCSKFPQIKIVSEEWMHACLKSQSHADEVEFLSLPM